MLSKNPTRYPGGKRKLAPIVSPIIPDNVEWCEPYCGGCGLGIVLLEQGKISHATFNDKDIRIYSMWQAMAAHTGDFLKMLDDADVTVDRFLQAKDEANAEDTPLLERGFATFILNRCARSGFIDGGVIGGLEQKSKYKVDCRFTKENLAKQIAWVGDMSDKGAMTFTNEDGVEVIKNTSDKVFIYADPPYKVKGDVCYAASTDHIALRDALCARRGNWMLSYDDCDFIRELYKDCDLDTVTLSYSANNKQKGKTKELLILP